MSHTLLIDGNAIGYSAHQATKLTTGGMEVQALFGMIKTMRELRQRYRQFTPIVLWDGRAEWRYTLHPDYKSNRTADPKRVAMKEAYAKQRPHIMTALRHLGVRQMSATSYEADDLAGYLVGKLSADASNRIGLITGDGDWKQLVRRGVFWRDPRDDARLVTADNFYDNTGCLSPFAFLESKILQGDASDCIPGVGGIGEKGAPEFIAEFGSVRRFWQACDSGAFVPKKKAHINLHTGPGRALYKRNFQLMQLMRVPAPAKDEVTVEPGRFDKDAFAGLCEDFAFLSILKNLDEFTQHFTH